MHAFLCPCYNGAGEQCAQTRRIASAVPVEACFQLFLQGEVHGHWRLNYPWWAISDRRSKAAARQRAAPGQKAFSFKPWAAR